MYSNCRTPTVSCLTAAQSHDIYMTLAVMTRPTRAKVTTPYLQPSSPFIRTLHPFVRRPDHDPQIFMYDAPEPSASSHRVDRIGALSKETPWTPREPQIGRNVIDIFPFFGTLLPQNCDRFCLRCLLNGPLSTLNLAYANRKGPFKEGPWARSPIKAIIEMPYTKLST